MKRLLISLVPCLLLIIYLFIDRKTSIRNNSFDSQRESFINLPKLSRSNHSYFFDQGSWFGFAFQEDKSLGFDGPFLSGNGSFSENSFSSKMKLEINNVVFQSGEIVHQEKNYTPGKLVLLTESKKASIQQELIFQDDHTAIIKTSIQNHLESKMEVNLQFSKTNQNYKYIQISGTKKTIPANGKSVFTSLISDNTSYTFQKDCFNQNSKRWNQYLNELSLNHDKSNQNLKVKALNTLMNNWRAEKGNVLHQGIIPSHSVHWFHGFWAWDSWKHSVAIAPFNSILAQDQIRASFDYQNEHGMVADCFYPDSSIDITNWRNTKPPLAAWASLEVYKISQDKEFLKELYPKLIQFHQWWYQYRDHDQNGLCEYGSTDGTVLAAGWESGMDNAVRFDSSQIIQNSDKEYSILQESVDLNSFLYLDKLSLAEISNILKIDSDFKEEASELQNNIQKTFYDETDGWYYDVQSSNNQKIKVKACEGWSPIWTGVASQNQVDQMINTILDSAQFNTFVPFPTLVKSSPKFNPRDGYWRGPVWLDQVYFALSGLRKYNYHQEADLLQEKLLQNAEGLRMDLPIRENYHPITGKGLNADNFSWSSGHLLLTLLEND